MYHHKPDRVTVANGAPDVNRINAEFCPQNCCIYNASAGTKAINEGKVNRAYRIRTGGLLLEREVSWAARRMLHAVESAVRSAQQNSIIPF